ncbi:Hypothetical predicted protein, partial [Lynx pardinus]
MVSHAFTKKKETQAAAGLENLTARPNCGARVPDLAAAGVGPAGGGGASGLSATQAEKTCGARAHGPRGAGTDTLVAGRPFCPRPEASRHRRPLVACLGLPKRALHNSSLPSLLFVNKKKRRGEEWAPFLKHPKSCAPCPPLPREYLPGTPTTCPRLALKGSSSTLGKRNHASKG